MTHAETVPPTQAGSEHPHREMIDGLRALADFYEQHEDAGTPNDGLYGYVIECFSDVSKMVARARELGGEWRADDPVRCDYFHLTRVGFPAGFSYQVYCSSKLIGEHVDREETVARTVREWVPSPDAREALAGLREVSP